MRPTLLLFLLIASLLLQLHRCAHADCEPATCGNLTIKYPFWLGGSNQSSSPCGHPAFQVWCDGAGGVASLRGSAIHVLGVDYASSSFVASHARVAADNGVCRTDFNISSAIAMTTDFTSSPRNRALCFLQSCNGTEPQGPGYVNATSGCTGGGAIFAYLAGSYDWDSPPAIETGGCTYTYFPVLGQEAAAMTAANYSRLLRDGFVMEWEVAGVGDCAACKASGGQCRYDNDAAALACICPAGDQRGSTCTGDSESHLPTAIVSNLCGCGPLFFIIASWALGSTCFGPALPILS